MRPRLPSTAPLPLALVWALCACVGAVSASCAEDAPAADSGFTPVDVNVDYGASDLGTSDTPSDLPSARPPTGVSFVGDLDEAVAALEAWGGTAAAAEIAGALFEAASSPDCRPAMALTPGLVPGADLSFHCALPYQLSGLRTTSLAVQLTDGSAAGPDTGDLVLATVADPLGRDVLVLEGDDIAGTLAELDARLESQELAAVISDMLLPSRCDRTAQVSLGPALNARVSCQSLGTFGGAQVSSFGLSLGPPLALFEVVALRAEGSGEARFAGQEIPVDSHLYLASSAQGASDLLSAELTPSETVASPLRAGWSEFYEGSGDCPPRASWLRDGDRVVRATWAPGPDLGVFRLCSVRVRSVAADGTLDDAVATITSVRSASNAPVQWLAPAELEGATAASLERAFLSADEAASLAARFDDLGAGAECEARLELGSGGAYQSVCRVAAGGLPEMGMPRLRSIREAGFDSAALIGVEPAPVSTLFLDQDLRVDPSDQAGPRIVLSQPPRAISQALIEGLHPGALTARLISWGVPEAAAREALSRLTTLIGASDAEAFPLILEDEGRALYFGRGTDADGEVESYVLLGFRQGGPELEVFVLADEGTAAPLYELRNPSEGSVADAVLGALADVGASDEVAEEVADEVLDQLAAGCDREPARLADEDLAGEIVVDCQPQRFSYARDSLSPAGVLHIWFEHDAPEGDVDDFTLLTLDFVRPLFQGSSARPAPGPLADSLALLRPRFDAPALPGLSPHLLLRSSGSEVDAALVDALVSRGLSTAEARLVDGTLARMLETGVCAGLERVAALADTLSVGFGCLRGAEESDPTLLTAVASEPVDDGSTARFTVVAPIVADDVELTVAVGLGELEAGLAVALVEGGFSADGAPGLAAVLGLSANRRACRERLTYALDDEGHEIELSCVASSDLLGGARAEGEIGETGLKWTAWRVTRDGQRAFFYTLDDPTRDGEETTIDAGVRALLATPVEE